jgi:hypothetical protein
MLKNISTTEYVLAVLIFFGIYYLVIVIIFYGNKLRQLLSGKRPDKMKP